MVCCIDGHFSYDGKVVDLFVSQPFSFGVTLLPAPIHHHVELVLQLANFG
jgi:hypothetical protein